MKWYNSVKTKLLGFFFAVSIIFMITMLSVLTMLKNDALVDNASKEVDLATTKILSNLQNEKYRLEEIVLALASIGKELRGAKDRKKIIVDLLKVNSSGLITSGGVWFEPYSVDENIKDFNYFFNYTPSNGFKLIENYTKKSDINYRDTEFYMVAKYLKEGEIYWTKVYRDPVTNVQMVTVVAPIYDENRFLGVASVDIKIEERGKQIFGDFKFPDRYLMMIDREGTIMIKSMLLSKRLTANKLYTKDCESFMQGLEYLKPLFDRCQLPSDYNRSIANELANSREITPQESKRVASIIGNSESNSSTDITREIRFVDDDPILKKDSIIATFHFPETGWRVMIGIPEEQVLSESNAMYQKIIKASMYLTVLATLLGYFLLNSLFIKPIESISEQLYQNSTSGDNHYRLLESKDKGEIGALVEKLNLRTMALMESRDREAKETQKRILNEKLLAQQSKMAAMGEMMDSVAHQWKQPLNALTMYTELLRSDFEDGVVDDRYIEEFRNNIQLQINHMLSTLDEFRTFFRPNKEEEKFLISDIVTSVLFLTKDEFMKNSITINIIKDDPIEVYGYKNEFIHLVLNIINNAKDAFVENDIENRVIDFAMINNRDSRVLKISDNAGGIPEDVIDTLFEANVTTKPVGKGTGIGLFMSMQIAKKHNATLSAHNTKSGACFVIEFGA
ncbi:TWO-COMPONENT HYBRID PROTEIN [hydrothermal vent metagenome]|uniref:TWO-COMPONENT HYBRID PROTEIN n=1 Tax=hydrothermal vent metagenome TaxID=652676 RepID=A0A1W1CDT9_9ZZZZ